MSSELGICVLIAAAVMALRGRDVFLGFSRAEQILTILVLGLAAFLAALVAWEWKSAAGRKRREARQKISELPGCLKTGQEPSVLMGVDEELGMGIYLPDSIRSRHVHVMGATGSGKTESVILNFLRQDVARGLGAIILDAKGDASFLAELGRVVPAEKLKVFDLSSESSLGFHPLELGKPLEAAQRLFASLTWSEEYYQSKALAALQQLFENHFLSRKGNPTLADLSGYLKNQNSFAGFMGAENLPKEQIPREFAEISGLRDQVRALSTGHLLKILSPEPGTGIDLRSAASGSVLYFRLQSLLSPKVASCVGKLLINNLSFLAGTAHRESGAVKPRMVPVYLDEFASFACLEFADLISKARSAGFALHFSHQSVGDLAEVSQGFLGQITDNSATKIILRINDPDSAEFFARAFGTELHHKVTQRITNAKVVDTAELVGEGSLREVQRFRASPNLFKTLPTGVGAVLVAHGFASPQGASHVFRIKFPKLKGEK